MLEEPPEALLEKDMFFTIWTKPKETFTYIFILSSTGRNICTEHLVFDPFC